MFLVARIDTAGISPQSLFLLLSPPGDKVVGAALQRYMSGINRRQLFGGRGEGGWGVGGRARARAQDGGISTLLIIL